MKKHSPDNEISPGIIKADIVTAQQSISYFKAIISLRFIQEDLRPADLFPELFVDSGH